MRRYHVPFGGNRFIGSTNTNQGHDLANEDTDKNACQIDEIATHHVKRFDPDTLEKAHEEGFENCDYCLGDK